jgi:hypothetical protein|nr:hypothetical protein Q903MT_gene959 [Picea sitchensis]
MLCDSMLLIKKFMRLLEPKKGVIHMDMPGLNERCLFNRCQE